MCCGEIVHGLLIAFEEAKIEGEVIKVNGGEVRIETENGLSETLVIVEYTQIEMEEDPPARRLIFRWG